jgi:protein-disulfide isomerase
MFSTRAMALPASLLASCCCWVQVARAQMQPPPTAGIAPRATVPALTSQQQDAIDAQIARWVAGHRDALRQALDPVLAAGLQDPGDGVFGPDNADVTIAAFIDRDSPASVASFPVLMAMAVTDPHLRILIKELPLLSAGSVAAARVAVAAHRQGMAATRAFEAAMVGQAGPADRTSALRAAARAGLAMVRLVADADSPETLTYLKRVRAQAGTLDIRSTPTFLIGGQALTGLQGTEALRAAVQASRDQGTPR